MDLKLNGKKVLITGADGFIGSHLLERLLEEGSIVRAFCFYNSFNSLGWIDSLPTELRNEIEIFTGDIRDPYGVKKAVKDCDIVFHLAALIGIPFSYHSPDSYVDTNIRGTLNVLQAAREASVEKIMVTSTSEVYGTALYVPIDEKHARQGQSPYSATKIGADSLADSFFRSFGLPVTIVRPFNTYGPRQSARAVIPSIITQLLSGKTEIKLGSLHPTRDFVFVKDIVQANLKAMRATNAGSGEAFNIATGQTSSLLDLLDALGELTGKKIVPQFRDARQGDIKNSSADISRAKQILNYAPRHTLKSGLEILLRSSGLLP